MTRRPHTLHKLIESTRQRLPELRALHSQLAQGTSRAKDFRAALQGEGLHVIAEVKLASPSRGSIAPAVDPTEIARSYVANGASAISFLTEPKYFGGDMLSFRAAREACPELPFLMKDFFIDPVQIDLASALGADCILLIVAALSEAELKRLMVHARSKGLSTLVEVHTRDELNVALDLGAKLVGINNRDLKTLQVDLDTSRKLAPMAAEKDVTLVAESGISSRADMEVLAECGIHAFLVGSALMSTQKPGEALRALIQGDLSND